MSKKLFGTFILLFSVNVFACPQFSFDNLKCTFVVQDDSFEYSVERLSNTAVDAGYLFSATFEGATVDEIIPSTVTEPTGLTTTTSCQGNTIILEESANGLTARQEMVFSANGMNASGTQLLDIEVCDENDVCTIRYEVENFTNNCNI